MSDLETDRIVYLDDIEPLVQKELYKQFEQKEAQKKDTSLISIVDAEVVKLSELQQKVVNLFFWENLTVDEIAKEMKLKKQSIKKLLDVSLELIKDTVSRSKLRKGFVQE